MRVHSFEHLGFGSTKLAIGTSGCREPGNSDKTLIRWQDQGSSWVSVRIKRAGEDGWHNFGTVEGVEMVLCGSEEQDVFLRLMSMLEGMCKAQRAGFQVAPALPYEGLNDPQIRSIGSIEEDVDSRFFDSDVSLPGSEEE